MEPANICEEYITLLLIERRNTDHLGEEEHYCIVPAEVGRELVNDDDDDEVAAEEEEEEEDDENKLPQIVAIPPEEQINPTPAIIEKWVQSGKTIYREVATNYQNSAGVDVFLQEVNGEVKKMTIHTPHHFMDCPKP